jgi:hypothetical protein
VRGYKVKVKYRTVDDKEKEAKKQAVSKIILQSFRKNKGKSP